MKKILIVDDQIQIRKLVEVTLGANDYSIFQATNGQEAIKIAKSKRPDLIIMDIMMPGGIDGIEATKIIKNDPDTNHCKIIILSGRGLKADRERGLDAGAEDYISKPFSPLHLIKKVESVLE
jgi:CheY-like chemotaxis protein